MSKKILKHQPDATSHAIKQPLQRVMERDLNKQPLPTNRKSLVNYCQVFLNVNRGEEHFDLCGYLNKQNFRFWGNEDPHIIHEEPLHPLMSLFGSVFTEES